MFLLFSHQVVSELFATPWTAACQASLFFISLRVRSNSCLLSQWCYLTISSFPTLLSFCPKSPSIGVFSNESVHHIRWPKYWSFNFSISPSNEYSRLISLILTGLMSLQSKGLSRVFCRTTVQKHQFFSAQPSLWFNSHIHTWLWDKL